MKYARWMAKHWLWVVLGMLIARLVLVILGTGDAYSQMRDILNVAVFACAIRGVQYVITRLLRKRSHHDDAEQLPRR